MSKDKIEFILNWRISRNARVSNFNFRMACVIMSLDSVKVIKPEDSIIMFLAW